MSNKYQENIPKGIFVGAIALMAYQIYKKYRKNKCCTPKKIISENICDDCPYQQEGKPCCSSSKSEVNKVNVSDTNKDQIVIELGGTSARIALLRKSYKNGVISNVSIVKKEVVNTENPEVTITNLFKNFKNYDLNEVGIASFGPICLDQTDKKFGSITTTPKIDWQNFPLTKFVLDKIGAQKVFIETDVNSAALAELKLGIKIGLFSKKP